MDWREAAALKISKMPEQALEIRERGKAELSYFARLVNPGYVYGEIHDSIFKWLEEYSLFSPDDTLTSNKLIMLPRAHLKSHMVATWAAWMITRHPEITILYVSATSGLAETQLYAIKNILRSSVYRRYYPEYIHPEEGKREKWSAYSISVDHAKRNEEGIRDPTIAIAGLTTNTTGWHADVIIGDDLVIPENAYTEDGRESVVKKSSQFTSIRNAGGFTLACGTRYHPNDIYATWRKQEYDVYNDEGDVVGREKVWDIKEYVVETDGEFLWPRTIRPKDGKAFGFNNQVLARIRAEYEDRTQFFAQYYNDPNDPGSNRISYDKFQYYDRKWLQQKGGYWYFRDQRLNVYASIDFAFSLSKKADDSAIVVIGIDSDSNIFVLDLVAFKTDRISDYFKEIARLHSKWEFSKFRAETTVAQSIIVKDLKRMMKEQGMVLAVEEYRPTRKEGTKEERMASILEHRYDNQTIWHFKGGYMDVLEEQLVQARPAHDDLKDALASAISIAVSPKGRREGGSSSRGNLPTHGRFGGIAFR